MPGKSRFGAARQAAHIHLQNLLVRLISMLLALTVLAIDHVQRLVHLLHLLGCTDLQGVLHHRLLGTTAASKGALQGGIGEPPRLDLDQALGSCQHTDQGVGEFVGRALLTRLLRNVHFFWQAPFLGLSATTLGQF